ncbi:hypothetical protein P148_SR1C00001G0562 [candidate division SR1 bacterium RAAC1_SR1_1]|nr:hypothetical protein P148_SR1C00001G0562 [candidate division SR1 bacterium RAAC1_SR1_1]
MPPETEKPILPPVDSQEKVREGQQNKEEKTSDIFAVQKESILKNPEFQGLEKETENTINKILTDYQNTNSTEEEKTKNQEIMKFLNIDNNLEKVFKEYSENIFKGKTLITKKMSLKRETGIIKDIIEKNYKKDTQEQNQEGIQQNQEGIQENQKDLEKRKELFKNIKPEYENLQKKNPISIDKNSPEYKKLQDNKELKESFGSKFEDFITYQYVASKIAEEVQKDPEKKISKENFDFIQSFNAIAKEYGQKEIDTKGRIPEETLTRSISDFTNHPNTSAVLEKNEKVANYISETQDTIKIPNEKFIETDSIQKQTLKFYQKDIQKDINKKYANTYEKLFDKQGNKVEEERKKLNQEDQKDIQTIIKKYTEKMTSELNTSLQKLVASKTIAGCTNEFVRYFNFNKQENNYGDIGLNTDKINIENNTLQTTMNFNGSKTTFDYNLNNGSIKYSDFLHIDEKTVNLGTNKFTDFPINFPSIHDIQDQAFQKIINSENISKDLNESNSLEDFYQRYSDTIGNVDIKNQESPYIKIVIERTLQKNKVLEKANKFITTFNKSKANYDSIEDKQIVDLYKILDTSLDSYSINEIKNFDNNLDRLQKEIAQTQQPNNPNTDPVLNTLFNPEKQEKDQKESYKTEKEVAVGPSMTEFFRAIAEPNSDDHIIDNHLFSRILDKREKNESVNISKESNTKDKNNKENESKILSIENNSYIDLLARCTKIQDKPSIAELDNDALRENPHPSQIQQITPNQNIS